MKKFQIQLTYLLDVSHGFGRLEVSSAIPDLQQYWKPVDFEIRLNQSRKLHSVNRTSPIFFWNKINIFLNGSADLSAVQYSDVDSNLNNKNDLADLHFIC